MNTIQAAILKATAFVLSISATGALIAGDAFLGIYLYPQETNAWCWAACGQMAMEFVGVRVSQCKQACRQFKCDQCCDQPTPSKCIDGGWPQFQEYGVPCQIIDGYLTWGQLQNEISVHRRPVVFSCRWNGGGAHMKVADGVRTVDNDNYVHVCDPWPPGRGSADWIHYDQYVAGPNYTHWIDFLEIGSAAPGLVQAQQPEEMLRKSQKKGQVRSMVETQEKKAGGEETESKAAVAESRGAANRFLATYQKLFNPKDERTKSLGLPLKDVQAETLKLGEPFPMVMVRLDELQKPRGGEPTRVFRNQVSEVLYPIQSADKVYSGAIVRRKNNEWQAASFGNTTLTELLVESRRQFAKRQNKVPLEPYVVSVPALNLYFVAAGTGGDATLVSVIDDPSIGIKAGVPINAATLMPRLIKAAERHSGLPR